MLRVRVRYSKVHYSKKYSSDRDRIWVTDRVRERVRVRDRDSPDRVRVGVRVRVGQ